MSNEQELQHHGILGMKWGVRRYQNKDGSLTPAGKSHKKIKAMQARADAKAKKIKEEGKIKVAEAKAKAKAQAKIDKEQEKIDAKLNKINAKSSAVKEKSLSEMTNAEIKAKIERIRIENELKSLTPEQKSAGQKFVEKVGKEVVGPAAIAAGKEALTNFLKKKASDALGLNKKDVDAAMDALKKEVDKLELQKRKVDAEDAIDKKKNVDKEMEDLRRDTDKVELEKRKAVAEAYLNKAKKKQEDETNTESGGATTDNTTGNNTTGNNTTGNNTTGNNTNTNNTNSATNTYGETIDLKDYVVHDTPVNSSSLNNAKRLGQSYVAGLLGDGTRDDD